MIKLAKNIFLQCWDLFWLQLCLRHGLYKGKIQISFNISVDLSPFLPPAELVNYHSIISDTFY